MMGYLIIEEDLRYGYGIGDHTDVGSENSFLAGRYIKTQFKEPLIFEVNCPSDDYPGHFFNGVIPVFSKALVEVIRLAGIDNFQIFPAILTNQEANLKWKDYFVFNAIGLIDAANKELSKSGVIMPGTDFEGMPELVDYDQLVIDPTKVKGAYMFRELSSPDILVFDDKIKEILMRERPPEGWHLKLRTLDCIGS